MTDLLTRLPDGNGFPESGGRLVDLDLLGSTKPDDNDDGMQKKSENVEHAQDRIRVKKPKNSWRLRNSPPTRSRITTTDIERIRL